MKRCLTDHQDPGQETARAIIRWSESIARRGNKLRLQWVLSHAEVEGNEVAERMAKEQQRANSMATANLGGFSHGQACPPQGAGNRSQNERNERVGRGKDKEAPTLHSAEKPTVPQGTEVREEAIASRYW